MRARDFRSIGRAAQEALRRRALVLIEDGMSQGEAARAVGVERQTVNRWVQRWRAQGEDGVLDRRRVSPRRGKGILTAAESRKVQRWIADQTPDQLKLPFALWTSRAVRDLIERRCGKRLGLSTVQLYLRRWGMTPQKPLARARERAPAAIQAWLERDYPALARRAKAEKAMIYWGDETGITNQDQIGRTWAPRGQTPVVVRRARRLSQSLISAVNNRGLMRFMLTGGVRGPHSPAGDGALNAQRFIAFLKRLIKDAGQKVVLIVDNLKVHHAKVVKAWVERHRERIELVCLPAYAPEHNPDEYLNNHLKQTLRQQPQPGSKAELTRTTRSVLHALQRRPARIQSYFTPAPVRYAA
jgi:transposase